MSYPYPQREPTFYPVKSGWAAGNGAWAVHAPTREEAETQYWETQYLITEILTRPVITEQERRQGEPHGQEAR